MSITIPTSLSEPVLKHLTCYCRHKDKISVSRTYNRVTNNCCIKHRNRNLPWPGPKVVMYIPLEIAKSYIETPRKNRYGRKVSTTINTGQFFFWTEKYGVDDLEVGYKIRMSCGNRDCVNAEHMELLDNKGNVIHHSDNVEKELDNEIITEKLGNHIKRRGQGELRRKAINRYKKCPITGISNAKRLIVSHIKPWRYSANDERLDVNNCLLLEAR